MDLLPESAQADDWFGPFLINDEDAALRLRELGIEVEALVPDCIGMSLSLIEHGVTFTVASRSERSTLLDAMQYADGGPCLRAMDHAAILSWAEDGAEESWHAFAVASASAGVASSLSLPILRSDTVIGGFNLYASSLHAFDPHHERLAVLLGAWAGGATTNADLGFSTRDLARQAPQVLQDSFELSVAAGVLARVVGCDHDEAVARLEQAAEQAAMPLPALVGGIVRLFQSDDRG